MSIEERVAQIEKRQALASEYNSWLFNGDPKNLRDMGEKWAELSARHGFAPDGTPVEKQAPGFKYGAVFAQSSNERYRCWKFGDLFLTGCSPVRWVVNEAFAHYFTDAIPSATALSALNAAPPPPGWVEPTRAEATGVCAKCYGTWMSSEHACPNCGRLAGKCLKCEGTGWWRNEPTADEGVKCPDCHGTGIRSFERPPPAPQPASEGVRWFFHKSDGLVWEGTSKGGRWLNSRGEFHQETRLYPEFFQKDADNYTELDGPPPHGKPLAKPATEGDGMEERARQRLRKEINVIDEALQIGASITTGASPYTREWVLDHLSPTCAAFARAEIAIDAAQRAASVRVVRTIETRSGVFVACGQSVGLGPGQSLAVIESAEAAAGEGAVTTGDGVPIRIGMTVFAEMLDDYPGDPDPSAVVHSITTTEEGTTLTLRDMRGEKGPNYIDEVEPGNCYSTREAAARRAGGEGE